MKNTPKKNPSELSKMITDFLPLIIFFIIFKFSKSPIPLIPATIGLIVVTGVILIGNYLIYKRISLIPLISAILLGVFGGMTILSGDDIFIKMKPTLVNILFAIILLTGYLTKKPLLQYLFGKSLAISHQAWLHLSLRWGMFFIFLAIINEIVWRHFSTSWWVQFKVFGILPITILFTILNIPYLIKELAKEEQKAKKL
jgi:intracellular septation protein